MKWTDEESALLSSLWSSPVPTEDLIHKFPGRTRAAFWNRACRMGLGDRHDYKANQVRTPEKVERARVLRAEGKLYREIAEAVGVRCGSLIRMWLDPEYGTKRKAEQRDRRICVPRGPRKKSVSMAAIETAAAELAKQIPADTRDLTARLCGDPLPGRRAIDSARGDA